VVHPSLGVKSVRELIARARNGRPLNYVSPGVGTVGHLVAEYFAQKAGIAVQHIPHKGASQAMMDIIAGNVLFGSMTWSSAAGQVRAGTVIPIAMSSGARIAEFPDVPTLKEEGFDDLVALTWYALSGPAGLPDDIVASSLSDLARWAELGRIDALIRPFFVTGRHAVEQFPYD